LVEAVLNPYSDDAIAQKEKQMRELAIINGTLKEEDAANSTSTWGNAATKGALFNTARLPAADAPAPSMDDEYASFMAELGGEPADNATSKVDAAALAASAPWAKADSDAGVASRNAPRPPPSGPRADAPLGPMPPRPPGAHPFPPSVAYPPNPYTPGPPGARPLPPGYGSLPPYPVMPPHYPGLPPLPYMGAPMPPGAPPGAPPGYLGAMPGYPGAAFGSGDMLTPGDIPPPPSDVPPPPPAEDIPPPPPPPA